VVGVGVTVVVHAQRGMQEGSEVAATQPAAPDDADDENPPPQNDSSESSLPDQGEPDLFATVSASESPRSLNDPRADRGMDERSRAAVGSDPFESSDDEPASEVPASRPAAKIPASSSRDAIDIVDVADDDPDLELDEPKQLRVATKQNKPLRRAPVQTLNESDAIKSERTDGDADEDSTGTSGPRLLGATDDMDADRPARAASRPPAAGIDTADPFADEDSADSAKKLSGTPVESDDVSMDDETADVPPAKSALDSKPVPTTNRPFKRDPITLDLDDENVAEPDIDRAPPAARPEVTRNQPETTKTRQPAAELGRTIEVEEAAGAEPAATAKPELPQITIEKTAPATAVLGRPMIYQIHVRNVGHTPAHQVVVEDVIPDTVKIDGSIPQALLKDNRLIWKLGTLAAGHEKKISVRVFPQSEGTIGGVATVNFAAEPKPGPNAASPQLKFDVAAPRQAAVGTPVEFSYRVKNVGQVPASGVTIRNVLPAGLKHPGGDDLEYLIGQLPAGKTEEVKLVLTAAQAGPTVNRVVVTADGNVAEEAQVPLEVVGPSLVVAREGPKRLFPNKTGTYSNTVTNPGLSPVTAVNVVETVPPGMEFVEASDGGTYNAAKRSVTWKIKQIAATASKTVKVTLRSNARGAQVSVVRAYDPAGSSGETVGATHVSGVCALTIEIGDIPPLVEAGETVNVTARIINRGSDTAANVRITIGLPAGMQLVDAKGPTPHSELVATRKGSPENAMRDAVEFAPIAKIEPKADAVIELTLKAHTNGTARLEVQAQCDQLPEPIRREEVTTIVSPQ
ncbi:MAG TPA: hypothetical protein VGH74_02905, partial [Planctomycetaceae bacterium]